jgi:phage tail sheath protein FI
VPVTPTYPGVYIEELPSTVHTIVGVATSITAFVGYTKRGPVNQATEVFSFGDFQRAFGDLDPDCPLTYAVQQFFLNGGSDAFIVRTAVGAKAATIQLADKTTGVIAVIDLAARTAGAWGNALRLSVDDNTLNPKSLFNVTVTEYVAAGGQMVPGRSESFRNLTLNSVAPTYVVNTINNNSQLLTATRSGPTLAPNVPVWPNPLTGATAPTSESGVLDFTNPVKTSTTANSFMLSIDGGTPQLILLPSTGSYGTAAALATAIQGLVTAAFGTSAPAVTGPGNQILLTGTTTPLTERSAVRVTPAPSNDASGLLKLGLAAGGVEVDSVSAFNPSPTGTGGADLGAGSGVTGLAGAAHSIDVTVTTGGTTTGPLAIPLTTTHTVITSTSDMRALLEAAIRAASVANPGVGSELGGASVALINNAFVVTAGGNADAQIKLDNHGADTAAATLGFDAGSGPENLASYSPPNGTKLGQASGTLGGDGTAPVTDGDILGQQVNKSGIYALEDVDLFNILVIPDDLGSDDAVISEALAYCQQRRAMLIVDLPANVNSLTAAQAWIKNPATPKNDNGAAYFPRALFPDAQQAYRPRVMPVAGAIAGLYARTDASRGVWKAPAGTAANLVGPTSVNVGLTDMENGTINPLGLNAVRSLPIYGFVSWGARTLHGADVMASQWKYVPVRRTALYIEESLFRGTKWVVFEPNDEPLWAQIRLSVGSFMHGLFRQGAFQGDSPRKAYLVKCDSETTTQNDIDQGIVNILVGFAPLKPAEFVVIQITQLAGQLDT